MKTKDMITIATLPNGNTVYSLKAFTGKDDTAVMRFFNRSLSPYHEILCRACDGKLNSIEEIENVYAQLAAHANKLFAPFMFLWNSHNFIAFLQQYKDELMKIGVYSFLPGREIMAKNFSVIEIDPNGIYVEPKPKKVPTHRKSRAPRLYIKDIEHKSEYFNKWIVRDHDQLSDSTYVVRTVKGDAPVMFFNIVEGNVTKPETLKDVKDVKAYEVDRLKTIYAQITGINYMDARPISYKRWKTLSIEKKIGTAVTAVDKDFEKKFFFAENAAFVNC